MRKGDLVDGCLPEVLAELAAGGSTGCLHVEDPVGEQAKVYLRSGQVYAASVPGPRPGLGSRLVTSGTLGPDALAEALEAQRTELQGWRLAELLVHLGYVEQPVVEGVVQEQVRESVSDLLLWQHGIWRFRLGERTREDVAPPVEVADLLAEASEGPAVAPVFPGPDAVLSLSAGAPPTDELAIDPGAWTLLCRVDGTRSIGALARDCGFTMYEAGQVVHTLVAAGLLEVDEASSPGPDGSGAPDPDADDRPFAASADPDELESSVSRASHALSALLGPSRGLDDIFTAHQRPPAPPKRVDPEDEQRAARRAEKAALGAQRRERDAAELAAAQAELEATRAAQAAEAASALPDEHEAVIVDLEARREAARQDAEEAQLLDGPAAADLAAFSSELSATAHSAPDAAVPPAPEAPAKPQSGDVAQAAQHDPYWVRSDTDTASLMRELSSLGLEDDPAPTPRTAPAPSRPVASGPAHKKRKGLFGRG